MVAVGWRLFANLNWEVVAGVFEFGQLRFLGVGGVFLNLKGGPGGGKEY